MLLKNEGARVWYDMQAHDLTGSGMERGISNAKNFIIFLSHGVMSRPYCQQEQRWAKQYECHLIGVKEEDERHGVPDFAAEKASAPKDLQHLLNDVEFIAFRRRGYEEKAMVQEILRRGSGDISMATPAPR